MTHRTSRYYPLNWIVEVRDPLHPWWKPMAAFNHDGVALDYAKSRIGRNTFLPYRYRVVARSGRAKFTTIWEQPE